MIDNLPGDQILSPSQR